MSPLLRMVALGAWVLTGTAATATAQRPDAPLSVQAGAPDASTADGMRATAAQVYRRAEASSRRAAFHLNEARRDGDRRRAACLDRVLSQSNAVLRMAGERSEMLASALAAGDPQVARHAVFVLRSLDERVEVLGRQTRVCNGERPGSGRAGTTVVVTVDRRVPRGDPTVIPPTRDRIDPAMPPPPPR